MTTIFTLSTTGNYTDLCPICWDRLKPTQKNPVAYHLIGNAQHSFHFLCLEETIKTSLHNKSTACCLLCNSRAIVKMEQIDSRNPLQNPTPAVREATNHLNERLEENALMALKTNQQEIVGEFLQRRTISDKMRGQLIICALENNYLAILPILLASGNISENDRYEAFLIAATEGAFSVFLALHQALHSSEEELLLTFCRAAGKGKIGFVFDMLNHPQLKIPEKTIYWSMVYAAENGHLSMFLTLLNKMGSIPTEYFHEAFIRALSNGHLSPLLRLLEINFSLPPERRLPISEADYGKLIHLALAQNNPNAIESLLQYGNISQEDLNLAIVEAAKKNYSHVVTILLHKGNITREIRSRAVLAAAKGDDVEIVKNLLQSGDILDEARFASLVFATKNGNLAIVDELIVKGQMTKANRGFLVEVALDQDHFHILPSLLRNGDIPIRHRAKAISQAVQKGHYQTAEVLSLKPALITLAVGFAFSQIYSYYFSEDI